VCAVASNKPIKQYLLFVTGFLKVLDTKTRFEVERSVILTNKTANGGNMFLQRQTIAD
jgi:hypothetical protein